VLQTPRKALFNFIYYLTAYPQPVIAGFDMIDYFVLSDNL